MKNIFYLSVLALFSLALITGCTKTELRTLVVPTINSVAATNIVGGQADASGYITDDGGSIITEAGICYDTIAGVTVAKNKVVCPHSFGGNFTATLTSLKMGKTYYFKAYAINSIGTVYGSEMSFFVPISINGYTSSGQIASSSLVGFWAFDNSYIDSISHTVGTANHASALSFVTGKRGKALQVASPGYVNTNVGNTIAALGTLTVACWIQQPSSLSNGPTTYMPFSLNAAGYSWEQTKFFMLFNNADNASGSYGKVCLMDQWFDKGQIWPKMLDGKWHHMAISFNGTSGALRVYVDGALLAQSSTTTLNTQANFGAVNSFTLGGPDDNANTGNGWMNALSGNLDDFRVYNKELTSTEVQSLYFLQNNGL
jgi:hypothetical protein